MFPQDEHNEALKEIDGASDRAAAIIAASAVETRLEQAIKHGMIREANIEKAMFRASGPLGSFEAKIQLARLIGVVSPRAHKEMKTIKEIRNLFAHDLGIIDFNTIRIRDKCLSLTMAREITLSDEEILEIGKKVRRGEIELTKAKSTSFWCPRHSHPLRCLAAWTLRSYVPSFFNPAFYSADVDFAATSSAHLEFIGRSVAVKNLSESKSFHRTTIRQVAHFNHSLCNLDPFSGRACGVFVDVQVRISRVFQNSVIIIATPGESQLPCEKAIRCVGRRSRLRQTEAFGARSGNARSWHPPAVPVRAGRAVQRPRFVTSRNLSGDRPLLAHSCRSPGEPECSLPVRFRPRSPIARGRHGVGFDPGVRRPPTSRSSGARHLPIAPTPSDVRQSNRRRSPSPLVGEGRDGGSRSPCILRSRSLRLWGGATPLPNPPPQGGREVASLRFD